MYKYPTQLPGRTLSAGMQCQLQFGTRSRHCPQKQLCYQLWCRNKRNLCVKSSVPAAEGTPCPRTRQQLGWCYRGRCVTTGYNPESVSGSWGDWSAWGSCSRTCGGGIKFSERLCNNPKPLGKGMYCLGVRRRYRSCNPQECVYGSVDFRTLQCAKFNHVPFRGKIYHWQPFNDGQVNPCALNCLASGYNFYTLKANKVIDGTKCYTDSHDVCINGLCQSTGCDGILGSPIKEDPCRVCGGDGSSCTTITGFFKKRLPKGYYSEVVQIPKGAVHFEVMEEKVSQNYLALKSETDKYYINGAWTIDWPRKFDIGGAIFHYERPRQKPESIRSLGPIAENMFVMVLLQEENKGIKYKYNIHLEQQNKTDNMYQWFYLPWSSCTRSCNRGQTSSTSVCIRKTDRTEVSEINCQDHQKPIDRIKPCNMQPCIPIWENGPWSVCTRSCGGGYHNRTVTCVKRQSNTEVVILEDSNCPSRKPSQSDMCNTKECPPKWLADEWGKCLPRCGPGFRTRKIHCIRQSGQKTSENDCVAGRRPPDKIKCNLGRCPPPSWHTDDWSKCSAKCGQGQQTRNARCLTYRGRPSSQCSSNNKPRLMRLCRSSCNGSPSQKPDCKDVNKVAYCPLVLKFQFCNRSYFHQMCCKTCSEANFPG